MFSLLNDSEMWLDIEGYEGLYSISNMGRVYSHIKNIILSGCNDEYLRVCLRKDGNSETIRIHVLVGNHFVGKREDELQFDHIDRNTKNNCASNLRLATLSEQNINKKVQTGSITGEKNIMITRDSYRVRIQRNNKYVFSKNLPMDKFSLDDAVKVRDEFLKNESHGYKNS